MVLALGGRYEEITTERLLCKGPDLCCTDRSLTSCEESQPAALTTCALCLQDLDQERFIVGVPKGRKIVVSHGWETSYHISPSGEKLKNLARWLRDNSVDKDPEAACFLE